MKLHRTVVECNVRTVQKSPRFNNCLHQIWTQLKRLAGPSDDCDCDSKGDSTAQTVWRALVIRPRPANRLECPADHNARAKNR